MCGIVGAVAQRDVAPILLEGLRRLEYRGYDSAGMAVIGKGNSICRHRALGKVASLAALTDANPLTGGLGIAHTRWATHGVPSTSNAHPHICRDDVAVVHNGIIENFIALREQQKASKHLFTSETDTEVIVHAIYDAIQGSEDLLDAVRQAIKSFEGAYALGVIHRDHPDRLIAARKGSPLIIGLGIGENFIASDIFALLPVTQRFIILEEGDVADIRRDSITIYDANGKIVKRAEQTSELSAEAADRGNYRHYMLKEIYEQPRAIADTLEGRLQDDQVLIEAFGENADEWLSGIDTVQIVACGTSYHAGSVARYWFEGLAGIPCRIEVASEFRYRSHVISSNCLFVTISQSGETADTLAALQLAKTLGFKRTLSICNVPESSLVRESDMALLTHAGPEIGVASTKAFTTQLVALILLVTVIGRKHSMSAETEAQIVYQLRSLPVLCDRALSLDGQIEEISHRFGDKYHALFLGRGEHFPIAQEGALKLKEISYIHAEAYPAGELKHGPLALIDKNMPVVAVAPDDELLEKLKSNLHEVRAREGELLVFADEKADFTPAEGIEILRVGHSDGVAAPIVATIPLQLLAYHVAVLKGTDVDQPRNLAKSVTVE